MSDHNEPDLARERVRFDVHSDGTVEGDDGDDGHLAETLRYVCRMGRQIGALLELGELERVSTLSALAMMARVAGVSSEVSIMAEVEAQPLARPQMVPVSGMTVQRAIDRALRRVTIDLASDWAAIITDESRLVGAMHDDSAEQGVRQSVPEVGLRALAILGALDVSLRETAVRLDFVRGSVLVAAVGEHALFTHADKFDVSEVVRTVAAVHGLLAGVNLSRADHITDFSGA